MLSFDDERWNSLEGGYRTAYDPRQSLRILESGKNACPRRKQKSSSPGVVRKGYSDALHDLAVIGATELPQTKDPETIRAILSILAISKGARTYGRMLLNYSEEELLDFEMRPTS
jgi:hypothetical protein